MYDTHILTVISNLKIKTEKKIKMGFIYHMRTLGAGLHNLFWCLQSNSALDKCACESTGFSKVCGWLDQMGLKLTQPPTGVGVAVGTKLGNKLKMGMGILKNMQVFYRLIIWVCLKLNVS